MSLVLLFYFWDCFVQLVDGADVTTQQESMAVAVLQITKANIRRLVVSRVAADSVTNNTASNKATLAFAHD